MPRTSTHLTEPEVKKAIAYWVEKGCPEPMSEPCVLLRFDRPAKPTPTDPGNGVTATVT